MAKSSHYPSFDVWEQREEWDDHTRQVVGKRKKPHVARQFFTEQETTLLHAVVEVIVDDIRLEVISFILQYLDESLASPLGEAQRKKGIPEKKQLYRTGLAGIEELSQSLYERGFLTLSKQQREELLRRVESGQVKQTAAWVSVPPKDFFKKLVSDVVSAYYSHPDVWSDIGYGGPAYPRGYVRVEKGLVDPWEAKRDGTS